MDGASPAGPSLFSKWGRLSFLFGDRMPSPEEQRRGIGSDNHPSLPFRNRCPRKPRTQMPDLEFRSKCMFNVPLFPSTHRVVYPIPFPSLILCGALVRLVAVLLTARLSCRLLAYSAAVLPPSCCSFLPPSCRMLVCPIHYPVQASS